MRLASALLLPLPLLRGCCCVVDVMARSEWSSFGICCDGRCAGADADAGDGNADGDVLDGFLDGFGSFERNSADDSGLST